MTASQDWFAIVGLAGRFPGAASPAALWELLCEGRSGITTFTDEQLIAAGVAPAQLAAPGYVKARGALDASEYFDAGLFGYVPAEAALLDPQHRLFLECAWEALEHAGYGARAGRPPVGVFASASASRYQLHLIEQLGAAARDPFVLDGTLSDFLALRAAYKLDLRGPAITVQSACSGSLVALHLACQSLLLGESELALAGAASIAVPARDGRMWQEGSIASRDGRCRPFDADATGTVGGDAAVAVVIRRLDDAIRDRDSIHAVIRGSAINNDGADKVGFTAPSVGGQARAIRAALAVAGVAPAELGYIEAHGSATRLGDPIEVAALAAAFAGAPPGSIPIGSIKSSIGHTDAAAGLSGLIKAVLCLRERTRVASLGFERANPLLELATTPFRVQTACEPWPADASGQPRRAGVSSFGMGGTNVHVVLEEPPARAAARSTRAWHLLPVSARSRPALEQMTTRLAEHLRAHPELPLADVAFTLQVGREPFAHRRAVVARTATEAAELLEIRDPARVVTGEARPDRPIAFLYPGLGDRQFHGVAELHREVPVFRAALDHCATRLRPRIGADVRDVLFAPPVGAAPSLRAAKRPAPALPTRIAQPAVFALSWALHALWTSLGVAPDRLAGYSLGEYVAATAAGVLALDDALDLVAARALLIDELAPGAMTAVGLAAAAVTALDVPGIAIAAVTGPDTCVAAGTPAAVDALEAQLAAREVAVRRLEVGHAFHTAAMQPAAARFAPALDRARRAPPRIPLFANVTGALHDAGSVLDPAYWCTQLAQPVAFASVVAALVEDPARVLIQVGPGAQLVQLARIAAGGARDRVTASSLPEAGDGVAHWLAAVAKLWIAGVDIAWARLDETAADAPHGRVPLPTYAFERKRHWIDRRPDAHPAATATSVAGDPARSTVTAAMASAAGELARSAATAAMAPTADERAHPATLATHAGPAPMAGGDPHIRALLAIWQTSFGFDAIGLDDDFFALGGHSLLALQLLHRLNRNHGTDFAVRDLVEHPTISAFAAHWSAIATTEAPATRLTVDHLRAAAADEQARLAEDYVAGVVARALGIPRGGLAADQDLGPLGLAANLADIVRALKRDFALVVHPHEVVARPTLAGLGRLLREALGLAVAAPATAGSTRALDAAAAAPPPSTAVAAPASAALITRNPPIAFVFSSARSGSTLLRVMLAGHPQLFCPPELHLLMYATLRERHDRQASIHFGSGLPRAVMELLQLDADRANHHVADWLARDLSIPAVYRELQALARPRLVIDKSPSYAESPATLHRIDDWFSSAYPIVLVRHPYAVMESYVRNRIGTMAHAAPGTAAPLDAWQQAERHWTITNGNLCQLLDAAPRPWHLIRYEELVTMPERTLRAACASLGVDYHPAVLTPYQGRRMIDGAGDPNLHEHDRVEPALADRWRAVELPRALGDDARRLAARFGYELPGVTA